MKKLLMKPLVLPIILIVIYLFSLMLGSYAIVACPVYFSRKPVLLLRAQAIAEEYLEGKEDTIHKTVNATMQILIFDTEENCLLHVTSDKERDSSEELYHYLKKYMPAVLSGKEKFYVTLAQEVPKRLNRIWLIAGVPIREHGSVVGTVFLVNHLVNVQEAVSGFLIYFTLFYWITIYLTISNSRRKRKLDELQQIYIANVTHAFKTPIASIKALAETLCDGVEPDPDRQQVYYGMILREANRQHHMIQDALELSKLQSNGMDFTKASIQAAAVFEPVLDKYAALCDCMNISLHISEELFRLPPLYTNAACVKQLLEILLDNALKFVREGGGVWVDAARGRNKTTICVRDNGIGITKEALPHVFERFYKCSHDFNESGSGLGLAIAKEIVSGLKEKIWVESEPGKGAAFFFTVHHK